MKCERCNKDIVCWNIIKGNPWCGPCITMLKDYFERKNETKRKNIMRCRCCKKYNEIKFTDSHGIQICIQCIKKYAPNLCPEILENEIKGIIQSI